MTGADVEGHEVGLGILVRDETREAVGERVGDGAGGAAILVFLFLETFRGVAEDAALRQNGAVFHKEELPIGPDARCGRFHRGSEQ